MVGTLYFYNGTCFPVSSDCPHEQMMEKAKEMIVLGMRHGVSMEEQKKDYKEQMDLMEKTLYDEARGKMIDELIIKRTMRKLGISKIEFFHSTWCLNICALLKMKVIENDENNGIM